MNKEQIGYIQQRINYEFKNQALLHQAFTRRSYAEEHEECEDNEVLEFIGDKVLDLVVVKVLAEKYGDYAHEYEGYHWQEPDDYVSEYDEGKLSEMKAQLVQKKTLARRIELLGFEEFLRMGKGDKARHVERQDSVKEDLFEAILGAVALDSGWDLSILESVVNNMLDSQAELESDDAENYIGKVQNWSLDSRGELPLYCVRNTGRVYVYPELNLIGPGIKHGSYPEYECELTLPGLSDIFIERATSEAEARMNAAHKAYRFLEKHNLLRTIQDEIDNPNFNDSIGQLEILARRGYFSIPKYSFKETNDKNGNPVWSCKCTIKEIDFIGNGRSSSKKDAKKQAAFDMLQLVLDEEDND